MAKPSGATPRCWPTGAPRARLAHRAPTTQARTASRGTQRPLRRDAGFTTFPQTRIHCGPSAWRSVSPTHESAGRIVVKKLTLGTALLALLLVGLPTGLLLFLTHTERGLQLIFDNLPAQAGRSTFQAEGAHGTLAGGFRIDRFLLQHDLVALRVEGIEGRLQVLPLLWQRITAENVTIRSAYVELRRRTVPPPKRTPRFLPGFLSIDIDDVRLANSTLKLLSGTELEFRNVESSGVIRQRTIRFFRASGMLFDTAIDGTALLTAADPLELTGTARFAVALRGQPKWVATADVDGPVSALAVRAQLLEPFRADAPRGVLAMLGNWNYKGRASVRDFDLRRFGGGGALGIVSGELDLEIDRNGYRARGPLDPKGLAAGVFDTEFDGTYARRVVNARLIRFTHRSSGAQLDARGAITIASPGPRLDLTGEWRKFRWPLVGADPPVRSSGGRYTLRETWPYALEAEGAIDVPALGIAAMPLRMAGRLATNQLSVERSELGPFGSTTALSGVAQWSPAETWRFAGNVRGFDPGRIRPDLPGSLDFALTLAGEGFGAASRIEIGVKDLRGRLRNTAARGAGRVQFERDSWRFQDVTLTAGGLRGELDGTLTPAARNLAFRVDASDLTLLDPEARGSLKARGSIAGTAAEPIIKLQGSASALRWRDVRLRSAEARVDFDPRSGKTSDVVLRGDRLELADRSFDQIEFRLQGQSEAHTASFETSAANLKFRMHARGGFSQGLWRGTGDRFDLDVGNDIRLRLVDTLPMEISTGGGRLERFCLTGNDARLCPSGQWSGTAWRAQLDAADLPLTVLTAGLTPQIRYEGKVDFKASGSGAGAAWQGGELQADLSGAQLRRRRPSGKEDLVKLGSGRVTAKLDAAALNAEVALDAGETGRIAGELLATRNGGALMNTPLRGSFRAATSALGIINVFVPAIDRAAGTLDADLAFGGTLGRPLLSGVLKLANGELDLYQINLALRGATLEARLLDNGLRFNGSAKAGAGTLETRGDLVWRGGLPYGTLKLSGTDLLLVDVPEARVSASPNLEFKLDGRRIDVTGAVLVPAARIAPADLAGAVIASSDERLVGAPIVAPEERFQVWSNIRLILGERVMLDTFGLSGRLAGNLTTQTSPDGASRGTGELSVTEGKYAALGRRLDIERGRLLFSGGLLGDPAIDLRATKVFPEVKAGVNVRGTLRQPRMTFFSEPSLPQSQIVSLIIAGGSLESAQNSERSGAGRNALLAQGGAILAQQFGSRIGIEDVGIEQNLANETSLVLGKYLSPRLYVSYGISFAESINTLKMRYSIDDRWTVKTEAGREQSAEIVYTIER